MTILLQLKRVMLKQQAVDCSSFETDRIVDFDCFDQNSFGCCTANRSLDFNHSMNSDHTCYAVGIIGRSLCYYSQYYYTSKSSQCSLNSNCSLTDRKKNTAIAGTVTGTRQASQVRCCHVCNLNS